MIKWHNHKSYNHETIVQRVDFITKNMFGFFPIYPTELHKLSDYAKKNNISLYELLSLRNLIKIQKEIYAYRKNNPNIDYITDELDKFRKSNKNIL